MCKFSRPNPEDKRVYCGRYPPQLMPMMRQNPVTKQMETMFVSILPDVLNDIVCGEFVFGNKNMAEICKK